MCIELTKKNIHGMKTQMQRMGYSQDWEREFVTMTPEYKEKTQLSFLKMYHEGLIYRAVHPVNWCPRCETAIAFAEVEYTENETFLNYLEFPSSTEESGVPIATTRPELLAACVAVVVHPDDERYQHLEEGETDLRPSPGAHVSREGPPRPTDPPPWGAASEASVGGCPSSREGPPRPTDPPPRGAASEASVGGSSS